MGRAKRPDEEMDFWDHVEELRQRIIRCVMYVTIGAAGAWFYRTPLLHLLEYPALEGARRANLEQFAFRIFEAAGGFMLMIQVAILAGIVLASPLITMEIWGFIAPALYPHEKRWVLWAVPSATALFLAGVATCYWIAPAAFAFFLRFNLSIGVQPELTLGPYLYFFMRLLIVFGVLFELPLFLMLLAAVGLVTSRGLLRQWRVAIVAVFLVAAIATPTGDALTMTVLATPMLVLYALSVLLVRIVERRRSARVQQAQQPPPEEPPEQRPGPKEPSPPDAGDSAPEQVYDLAEIEDAEEIERLYEELNEDVPPSLDA